jgi:hypothetical protein
MSSPAATNRQSRLIVPIPAGETPNGHRPRAGNDRTAGQAAAVASRTPPESTRKKCRSAANPDDRLRPATIATEGGDK